MSSAAKIRPYGECVAATALFRYRGQHTLTPIVKATFAFADGTGRMKTTAPAPLRDVDRLPGRARADVVVLGASRPMRFGLHRDGMLLDLNVVPRASEPPPGAELPEKIRRAVALGLPLVLLPDDFDWSTLQLAPANQRVGLLRGDEWVLIHGQEAALRMQLPSAVARCQLRSIDGAAVDAPVPMQADTLVVDMASATCSLVWRGSIPLPNGVAAEGAELAVWVQTADALGAPELGDESPETLVVAAPKREHKTMPFSIAGPVGAARVTAPIVGAPWSGVSPRRAVPLDPNSPCTVDVVAPDEPRAAASVVAPSFPPRPPVEAPLDETRPMPVAPPPRVAAPAPSSPPPPLSPSAPPSPPSPRTFAADRGQVVAPERATAAPRVTPPRPMPAFGASLKKDLYAFGPRKR